MPIIKQYGNYTFFIFVYSIGLVTIFITNALYFCVAYNALKGNFQSTQLVEIVSKLLNIFRWILFCPLFEVLISVFECEDGYHKIDNSTKCFRDSHIALMILSILFGIILLFLVFVTTFFYGERQAVEEDAEARLNDNTGLLLLVFRVGVIIFVSFNQNV